MIIIEAMKISKSLFEEITHNHKNQKYLMMDNLFSFTETNLQEIKWITMNTHKLWGNEGIRMFLDINLKEGMIRKYG